ncbi:hypothetical protein [Moumouvirus maliensis]|nr:hypothetical protein [Moumouvirus maliensis]
MTQEKYKNHFRKYETDQNYIPYINRPLGWVNAFINEYTSPNTKIGLALCHGHNHSIKKFKKIKFINYWYMVDGNGFSFPDYVCDLTNAKQVEYLPDEFFDCIMSIYCRVIDGNDKLQYFNMLDNVKRTLKPHGFFISTEIIGLFYRFMEDDELFLVNDQLIKFADKDELNEYINKFDKKSHFGEENNILTEKQKTFIILNYFMFRKHNIDIIKHIIIKNIKLVFERNGYYYVDMIGKYVFFVPIEKVTNKKLIGELLK